MASAQSGADSPRKLKPDKRAKYDTVAQVLAMAQRNGLQRIGFTGQEQLLD